ncbi:MAG TPA: hypothetical protein VFZ65_16600 [Planctomycetota bacterium]|nr:hypothetical protein [Planctomycetota bacterium]
MRFPLDENLSDRLLARLVDVFPGSCHVKELGFDRRRLRRNASTLRAFGDSPKTSLLIVAAEDAAC